MLSPSLEDYLEEIYRFTNQDGFVRTTDVADKLNVSLPSVTKAVKKLTDKGYLNYQPYKSIKLTKKGAELGKFLVTRNKTLQEFVQIIGSDCNKEQEAEAMEHYLSRETVRAITSLVDFLKQRPQLQQELIKFKKNKKGGKPPFES
ncbi:metal-dependent transcriptional regulator [Halanaerobaculum tunisiense]